MANDWLLKGFVLLAVMMLLLYLVKQLFKVKKEFVSKSRLRGFEIRKYYTDSSKRHLCRVEHWNVSMHQLTEINLIVKGRVVQKEKGIFKKKELYTGTREFKFIGRGFSELQTVVNYRVTEKVRKENKVISSLAKIDKLSGRDFENLVELIFIKKGYRVELTPHVGDGGVDLIIYKDNQKIGIQLKRSSIKVDKRGVDEILRANKDHRFTEMWLMSNNSFLPSSIEYAYLNNVKLIDRMDMIELLESVKTLPPRG